MPSPVAEPGTIPTQGDPLYRSATGADGYVQENPHNHLRGKRSADRRSFCVINNTDVDLQY